MREIYNAEDIDKAQLAIKAFDQLQRQVSQGRRQDRRQRRRPVGVLRVSGRALDPPGDDNPIESTFATVRSRTKVTKGPGSRAAGIAMAYKLIDAAQARWQAVNAPHLVALLRAGAVFHKGRLLERPTDITPPHEADGTNAAATTRAEIA